MRGKVLIYQSLPLFDRITPAYAGKSDEIIGHEIGVQDHPRVCGEKPETIPQVDFEQGSPPRMRGKDSNSH